MQGRRIFAVLLWSFLASTLAAQGSRELVDEASGLKAVFPSGLGPIETTVVRMSEPTAGRSRFRRHRATRGDSFYADVSLVPYPAGRSLESNPYTQLGLMSDGVVQGAGGRVLSRTQGWQGPFPSIRTAFTVDDAPTGEPRYLNVQLVLYRDDIAFAQAIGVDRSEVESDDVTRFFDSIARPKQTPPARYEHSTGSYSFRYPPGTRLQQTDDVLTATLPGGRAGFAIRVDARGEPADVKADLARLAAVLGERVAAVGPVTVEAGPRRVRRGKVDFVELVFTERQGDAAPRRRGLRFHARPGECVFLTAYAPGDEPRSLDAIFAAFEPNVERE